MVWLLTFGNEMLHDNKKSCEINSYSRARDLKASLVGIGRFRRHGMMNERIGGSLIIILEWIDPKKNMPRGELWSL
jgi:hypothetical protein